MIHIDAQVLWVYFYFNIIGEHGQNFHACKGGLTTLFCVGRRNAYQAMHPLLGTQHSICVFARYRKGCPVNANNFCYGHVVYRCFPATLLAVRKIHFQQHLAPVLSFKPSLTRRYGNDCIAQIELIAKPARKLNLIEAM